MRMILEVAVVPFLLCYNENWTGKLSVQLDNEELPYA